MEHIILHGLTQVIDTFSSMVWQIYWPLAFGLILSSILRNILPMKAVVKHLGQTNPKSILFSTLLGMVSSSCSYAAASLSKTLLIKKASLSNAMAFLVASTNLILEMFIVLVSLLGWQFLWGEVIGAIMLVIFVAVLFQFFPKNQLQALQTKLAMINKPAEASCNMDMSNMGKSPMMDAKAIQKPTPLMDKISRSAGYFQMDISMIGKEILIGVVISSILIALMPVNWWQLLFIGNNSTMAPMLHSLLDVVIGIFVAVLAYVCSVGNLLLAAALWHGGISFGGVMGFILSDVLTIPMTHVYRNYYGKTPARWMVSLLFLAILATGILIDLLFRDMDWSISRNTVHALHESNFGLNLTTIMNLIFIPLSLWYYRLGKRSNGSNGMDM